MPTVLLILNLKNCIDQIKQFSNNQVSISLSKYFILHENAYENSFMREKIRCVFTDMFSIQKSDSYIHRKKVIWTAVLIPFLI